MRILSIATEPMKIKSRFLNSYPGRLASFIKSSIQWNQRMFAAPSPLYVKQACLVRNAFPNATWVETGTYMGQTTKFLSGRAKKVYSIEPEPTLCSNAKNYFSGFKNVEIINGTSEKIFPDLLPTIRGDVNFWLDGHYSAGLTFKGTQDTPIVDELREISNNLSNFDRVCILVDDVRCFDPSVSEYTTYPSLDMLVDWARSQNLRWHIEHDIFCAKGVQ